MNNPLRERLANLISKNAEELKASATYQGNELSAYCEGANSLAPIVVLLAEALEEIAKDDKPRSIDDRYWLSVWRNETKENAHQALAELQKILGEQ